MNDFRRQLASLSVAEKVELLDAVWESVEADPPGLTEAQREVLARSRNHKARAESLRRGSLGASQGGPAGTVEMMVTWPTSIYNIVSILCDDDHASLVC